MKFFVGNGALLDIDYQNFFTAAGMQKVGASAKLKPNLERNICNDNGTELTPAENGIGQCALDFNYKARVDLNYAEEL